MLLLVTALLQALRCAAVTTVTRLTIDAADLGPVFDGVGGNSGGGGGTRLLVDYPPAQRSDLLDLMFKPKFGMSLQHIKVEIGSDGDTTQGSEPTHARSPTDINFDRGYEVWLMEQAVQRRPGIQLSGLEWGVPGWVAAAPGGFWSDAAISYLTGWAKGLRDVKGLNLTALGVAWNERSYNTTFIKAMRKSLDAAGLKHVRTIAPDSWGRMWQIVGDMQKDPELAAAIDIVGTHQECTGASNEMPPAGTAALGKKLWSTEQHIGELGKFGGCDSSKPFVPSVAMPVELDLPSWDRKAGLTLARSINQGFIVANMTSTLIWTPTYSWYEWIKYAGKGLVVANTPWSGWYSVPDAVWCVAHTTQFTEVGWRFSGPGGSKMLVDGAGSAVSYISPDGRDLSVVVETAASNATNELEIELRGFSVDHVHVWRTLSPNPKNVFAQQTPLAIVKGQPLRLSVAAGEVLTLSTTTGQRKGSDGLKVPPPSNFSALLPHIDDFESYAEDTTPKYSSDMSGVYSVATVQDLGKVLRQRTALQPAATHEGNSALGNFATTFGDASLFDYELQITARLLKPAADGSSPATDAATQAPHAAPFLFVSVQMSDGGPNSSSCVLSGKPLPPVCCERLAPHAPYCGCCSIGKGGFAPSDLHEELAPGGPLLKFTFEAGKTTWSLQHSRPIKVLAEGQLDWPIFSWKTVSLSAKRGADGNATLTARAGGKQLASVSVTLSPYAWRGPAAFGQAINEAAPFSEWDNMTIRKLPDTEQARSIRSIDEGSLPDFDLAHAKPIKTDDKEQEYLTPQWETVSSHATPVIGPAQTTPHGVYQGFETGQFFKNNGTYYVAINELGLCTSVIWDRCVTTSFYTHSASSKSV
jgi:hypothetical protein